MPASADSYTRISPGNKCRVLTSLSEGQSCTDTLVSLSVRKYYNKYLHKGTGILSLSTGNGGSFNINFHVMIF